MFLVRGAYFPALFCLSNHSTQTPLSICCLGGKGFIFFHERDLCEEIAVPVRWCPQCGESLLSVCILRTRLWSSNILLTLVFKVLGGERKKEEAPG